jgi:hypothetical protein
LRFAICDLQLKACIAGAVFLPFNRKLQIENRK